MANEQNLKPQNQRTKSEQRKIAQMGGIASGEKRRHQRDLREAVKALQSVVVPVKGGGDGLTYAEAIARAVVNKVVIGVVVHGGGIGIVGETQLFLKAVLQVSRV